jgi:uncharacterized membrane protein YczE
MNKTIKDLLWICVGVCIGGFGCATMLSAGCGVAAWDALALTLSNLTGILTGTCTMVFNISCVVVSFLILRKNFKLYMVLQVPLAIAYGATINFVQTTLYANLALDSFALQIVMYLIGMVITAFGVSIVMNVNLITFPLETTCQNLVPYVHLEFSKVRQLVDVISIILSVAATLLFHKGWTVGVGTVIGMCCYGPALGIFMKLLKPITNPESKEALES